MLLLQDRDLLLTFREGRPSALEVVFDHYQPMVCELVQTGFAFQSGGRPMRFAGFAQSSEVFDVVHDIFRAAFEAKARQRYGGVSPYGAYLATIARNLILSRLRSQSSVPLIESLDEAIAVPANDPSPEQAAAQSQQTALVQDFLGTLTDFERALVQLRFDEELGQESVAERLGVGRKKVRLTEGTIRERLNRFLSKRGWSRPLQPIEELP